VTAVTLPSTHLDLLDAPVPAVLTAHLPLLASAGLTLLPGF
jgi:hypothetical protein